MVQQGVKMAKAGEGIRIAFERLGVVTSSTSCAGDTHGTVTDLN